MDEAFGESEAELFERADRELERYRRAPGESVAHFLAEMRRLRAQYYRIDPDSRFSDKAWAQKLLQKASLSRREKHDCYYAAGAVYDPMAIEKALRVRCGRIHEDEKKVTPYRPVPKEGYNGPPKAPFKKRKVFMKKRVTTTHVEGAEEPREGEEEEVEDEEEMQTENEVYHEEREPEQEDEDEEDIESEEELEEGELKEAFAAGWKAKQKTAEAKKNRGWKNPGHGKHKKEKQGDWQAMKKDSTCGSCGLIGHWKGDPECINVKNGKDPPHTKKSNTVHFTFMVGQEHQCDQCLGYNPEGARFCNQCGAILRDPEMVENARKRYGQQERDDWDVVRDDQKPFSFETRRDTARAAVKLKPKARASSPEGKMRLHGRELMAALPSMSKEEKRELHRALQEDEWRQTSRSSGYDARYYGAEDIPVPYEREDGYRERPEITPPEGKDKPKPIKERELADFRRSLYEGQCEGGRVIPSSAAPPPTEAQSRCTHPLDKLRWSANADGHYARCKLCDLKHVIYYSVRHGVLMVTMEHNTPPGVPEHARVWIREDKEAKLYKLVNSGGPSWDQVCCRVTKDIRGQVLETRMIDPDVPVEKYRTVIGGPPRGIVTEFWYVPTQVNAETYNEATRFIQAQTPGLAIADSGCRNAVGGVHWHRHYQKKLDELGIPWTKVTEKEVYKFGAGAPIISREACLYPALIHGTPDVIRMSVVAGGGEACPGLVGPGELSRWKAVFRFADRELELNGQTRSMQLTATRHPGINLLEDVPEQVSKLKEFWKGQQAKEKMKTLTDAPQTYAFLSQAKEDQEQEESEEEEQSEDELLPDEAETRRDAKVETWMKHLTQDLGVIEIPTIETAITGETEEQEGSASEEEDVDSSSSHEKGVEVVTDTSSEEEDLREEMNYREVLVSRKKEMHKGVRKKIGHSVSEIKGQFQKERQKERRAKAERKRKQEQENEKSEKSPSTPRRRWTVLEIFTWTCAISMVAAARGWNVLEPVSLPRWNLLKQKDYNQALSYLHEADPDLLALAWPCTVWSPLQTFGRKTAWERMRLIQRRKEQRTLLRFVRDAALDQRKRGGALVGENPDRSLAWKEPLIEEAFEGQGGTRCDMCQFGLKIPKGPIRKRTKLRGTEAIMKRCSRMCKGDHHHAPCLGGVKINDKWMNVSDFAGGYTSDFALQVVLGAEEYLAEGRIKEVFVEGDTWPEEDLEEQEEEEDFPDRQEEPEDKEGKNWKIQKVHERLGHPTNETLTRMLSLAGASKEVVAAAKDLQCPVCQEIAPPGRYLKQRPEIRPTTFGKEIHCDLKYLHDTEGKLYVALSMVDAATSFHAAVLLRNRKADHVARKMARHWCSIYGIPETVVIDQGGEFDGLFIAWLETHGIHSKITGARSGWQHGFAERHGALLGASCSSLMWQFKAKGRAEAKDCLAASVQAKNMTLSRKGYTPFQLVFGRQPMFPDLLEESMTGNLSLRDALGTEGEVQRAAEMRTAARAVLLRQDVQDKIRRSLKRWPRGEERSFQPGEMIYFYSPTPKTARFRKDGGSWRGPAVVLMKESSQRYFVSWRGRCLLVSSPNMRAASALEAGDFAARVQEMEELEDKFEGGERNFEELSNDVDLDEKLMQTSGWSPHDGAVARGGIHEKTKARQIAKSLRGMRMIKTIRKDKGKKTETRRKKEKKKTEEHEKVPLEKEVEEALQKIDDQLSDALSGPPAEVKETLRRHLQDDVPIQIKRKRLDEVDDLDAGGIRKRFRHGMINYTLLSLTKEGRTNRANQWASKTEVRKLADLLDLPIVGVKYHFMKRKKFEKPPKGTKRGRITVLFGEQVGQATVCHETAEEAKARPNRKATFDWKGVTLFLREEGKDPRGETYVELPDGIYTKSKSRTWTSGRE